MTQLTMGLGYMTTSLEGGARLRAAMRGYPRHLEPDVQAFLDTLPWRWRRAVELVYGRGLTHEQAGCELCVSRWTIARDLAAAAWRFS